MHLTGRMVKQHLPKVLFDGPYQQAAMRMYALFFPKQDAAARLTNKELKTVFLFLPEPAGIILFLWILTQVQQQK